MRALNKNRQNTLIRAFLVILFAATVIPTLFQYMPMGHDTVYHSMRLMNIAEEMKHGNLFPSIYTYSMEGLGYGAPLFYADLFLYPYAALHALGLSIHWTFKIMQGSLIFLNFLSMYLCAKSIFKDQKQALVTALAYSFSYYSLLDIYVRAAIGECFGFIILPIVYLGYYDITHSRPQRWWILSLGMAGILFSHTLSVLLAAIMLVVLMVFDCRFWLKNLSRIRYLIYAALLCLGISCCFWLPMLEQMSQLTFRLSRDVNGVERFMTNLLHPLRVLIPTEILSLLRPTIYYQYPRLGSIAVHITLLFAFIALCRGRKWQALPTFLGFLFFLWMSGDYSPSRWAVSLLAVLQFAWRFMLPASLLLSMTVALGYGALKSEKGRTRMLWLTFVCAAACVALSYPFKLYTEMPVHAEKIGMTPVEYIESNLNFSEISDGQYLPDDLTYEVNQDIKDYVPPTFEPKASDERVTFECTRDEKNVLHVSFSGNPGDATIDLPLILYLGYEAETDDGTKLPVSRGESGMVRVHLGDMESGSFSVPFRGTTILHVSRAVTAVSVLFLAGMLIRRRKATKTSI